LFDVRLSIIALPEGRSAQIMVSAGREAPEKRQLRSGRI